jgi:septum formation protein
VVQDVRAYTTVVGEVADGSRVDPSPSDPESLEVRWVALGELDDLPLMAPFAAALPTLLAMLG